MSCGGYTQGVVDEIEIWIRMRISRRALMAALDGRAGGVNACGRG